MPWDAIIQNSKHCAIHVDWGLNKNAFGWISAAKELKRMSYYAGYDAYKSLIIRKRRVLSCSKWNGSPRLLRTGTTTRHGGFQLVGLGKIERENQSSAHKKPESLEGVYDILTKS
jgi:hypothetical protein